MKKRNLAFTVELLGLFILLVMVITVITQVFVMSRSHSLEARQLTEAVILAENAAEISSGAQDAEILTDSLAGQKGLLDLDGTVYTYAENEDKFTLRYAVQFDPDRDSYYIVNIDRTLDRSETGVLADDVISIYEPVGSDAGTDEVFAHDRTDEPVYTLTTSRFFEAAGSGSDSGSDTAADADSGKGE